MEELLRHFAEVIESENARLSAISEEQATTLIKEGGWSPKQVIGHLIDSASNNHQRFVRCALGGGLTGWPGYNTDGWVKLANYTALPWTQLVEFWAAYNRLLLHLLRQIPAEARGYRCQIGGEWDSTLEGTAASYVAHLEHHLRTVH